MQQGQADSLTLFHKSIILSLLVQPRVSMWLGSHTAASVQMSTGSISKVLSVWWSLFNTIRTYQFSYSVKADRDAQIQTDIRCAFLFFLKIYKSARMQASVLSASTRGGGNLICSPRINWIVNMQYIELYLEPDHVTIPVSKILFYGSIYTTKCILYSWSHSRFATGGLANDLIYYLRTETCSLWWVMMLNQEMCPKVH